MLVIDPYECIDCRICASACPVSAIYHENDLPTELADWAAHNAALSAVWPLITAERNPLPNADDWATVSGKAKDLDR